MDSLLEQCFQVNMGIYEIIANMDIKILLSGIGVLLLILVMSIFYLKKIIKDKRQLNDYGGNKKMMFGKKNIEQIQPRSVAVINPNTVPVQGSVIEARQPEPMLEHNSTREVIEKYTEQQQEPKITNLIVSSEDLEDGTFRYVMVSNAIYPIGPAEIEPK